MVHIIERKEQTIGTIVDLGISCILVPVSVRGALEMDLLNKLFDLPSSRCQACDEYIQIPKGIGASCVLVPCYDEDSMRFEYDRLIKELLNRREEGIALVYKQEVFDFLFGEQVLCKLKLELEKSHKPVTLILLN